MTCIVCGLPSRRLYRDACDPCNRLRLYAAVEFTRAAAAVHLLETLGDRVSSGSRRRRIEHAMVRLNLADQECIRLRMWTEKRSTKKPPWFYGDERSNTA